MRREFRYFYSLLFVSTCLFLFIPHNINAEVKVIQMMNNGQMDERVSFYAKTFGGIVFVTRDGEIIYSLPKVEEKEKSPQGWVLKEELVGGAIGKVTAEQKSAIGVSYFKGNVPQSREATSPPMASLWTRDI
jgi:hypothetical protein